jgi:hypothetical protein
MSDAVGRQQLKWFILTHTRHRRVAVATVGALVTAPPAVGLALFGSSARRPGRDRRRDLRHGRTTSTIVSRTIVCGDPVVWDRVRRRMLLVGNLLTALAHGSSADRASIEIAVSTLSSLRSSSHSGASGHRPPLIAPVSADRPPRRSLSDSR